MNTLLLKTSTTSLTASKWLLLFIATSLLSFQLLALTDEFDFTGSVSEKNYRTLISQLRCLVCQNESLASSHADLAKDLKKEVYGLMVSGKSNSEVKAFLVQRYGDFVLYQPPVKRSTLALWGAPFIALLLGAILLVRRIRSKSRQPDRILTSDEEQQIKQLLDNQADE